jgi:hypothetical protein
LTANAEGTAKLKAVSDLIAKSPLKNSPFAASNDPIAKLRGDAGNGLSHKQQVEKLYDLVTMNPETSRRLLAASISNIANQHPKIAEPLLQTLLAKQEAVRKAIAPTQNTNMPSPFEKEQTFKAPANAERQADNDLKLIQNPYYIMQKAKEGTVTAHDYDVVRSVHPEILRSLGQSILAASQKGTTLSYKERQSYSVIVPGLERTHAKVSSFQQTYANGTLSGGPPPGPPSGPSRKAMPNIGIGSFTPGQRIMGGGKH